MAEIPVTPEIAEFVANVLKAARAGTLKWDMAGGPKRLIAPLSSGYQVELREVSDLDGQSEEPDHLLSLHQGDSKLFTIDRRDVSGEELQKGLGETVEYSYAVFSELWRRALFTALNLTGHLAKVNSDLQKGLEKLPPKR